MEKIIESQEIVHIKKYFCDFCEQETSAHKKCDICGRNICSDHMKTTYYDIFTQSDTGDFPIKYCTECFEILEKMTSGIERVHKKYDNKIENLYNNFKQKCLERRKLCSSS